MNALALDAASACLVVIDVQEKLAAAMPAGARDRCIRAVTNLVTGAALLKVPVLVTEQYPRGLGSTVAPVEAALAAPDETRIEKVEFDACQNAGFSKALAALDRRTAIVVGMEAHICVWQTARSLVGQGLSVHVATDATCSRDPESRRVAEGLWQAAGATVTCSETALFDLLGKAGGDAFKTISRLIR